MNAPKIQLQVVALMITAAQAFAGCDGSSESSTSGDGASSSSSSGSSSGGSSSSGSSSGGSSSSGSSSSGGATNCMSTLPASPPGCADTPTSEAAFMSLRTTCQLLQSDLDSSNPQSPTLTAGGKVKICATCACQQKAYDYYALYMNCMDNIEAGNKALATNIYNDVVACGK